MRDTGSFPGPIPHLQIRLRAHLKNQLTSGHQIVVLKKRLVIWLSIQRRRLNVDIALRHIHARGPQTTFHSPD